MSDDTPEEVAKNSTKYLIIVIFSIVFLTALFFSIKYFYHPKPKLETYTTPSGFEFTHLAGLWNTEWKRGDIVYNLHFHYNPGQTKNISIIGELDEVTFNRGYVYITFNPEGGDLEYVRLAVLELSLNLNQALNVEPRMACTKNATACANVTILSCTNTTEPIIQLSSEGPTMVGLNNNCILVQGKREELIRTADRILFQWFGFI